MRNIYYAHWKSCVFYVLIQQFVNRIFLIEEILHSHTLECSLHCITDGPVANDFGVVKCPLGYKFNLKSQVCDGE